MSVASRPTGRAGGFVPPVYPFDKLTEFSELASAHEGGAVDLSIGTPCDPPPPEVVEALGHSSSERGYPTSLGSLEMREAAAGWMERRLAVSVAVSAIAACVGTKELVAGVPQWLRLRDPSRDTVLCPSLAYPTYEMGAILAGCRAVPVPTGGGGGMDLAAVAEEDAARALCLWVNSPANPGGQLEDLAAVAEWGRARDIPIFSDECYVEFTWAGARRTILQHGDGGVVAVHSLSKRSNLAGLRVGVYAGDPELVAYLAAVRRHAGFMVPGPVQHAAAVAFSDDAHVERQRVVYLERLQRFASRLGEAGIPVDLPAGSFYLWVPVPERFLSELGAASPAFALGRYFARAGGFIGSPGDAYGPAGTRHIRLAMVQPLDRLELAGERLLRSTAAAAST
ncbi:MAG: aminotransferase class I/II-fold pyridoxal phosphate-dependent enzyme [Acidimicrobiales bacterium]|jgi:aspartate/methionine/tyrosine aminotransferase